MNAPATPHSIALGFNDKRIQEVLSVLGLDAAHHALAEQIRAEVIAGRAGEFVNSCFATLARTHGFSLIEQDIGPDSFKQTWVHYLQCFGRNFDTAEYFEERLQLAAAFARAKI